MRALISDEPGGPESLKLVTLADPAPGPGELLLQVEATALNFFDTLIIEDRYQVKPPRPFAPGGECAGTVLAVGAGVDPALLGTAMQAWTGHGALAEKLVVDAARCVSVPAGVALEQASTIAIAYGTTLHAYVDKARLAPCETIVVLGASGGAGLAAVEIGKCLGARVIAVASSPEKRELALSHGADLALEADAGSLKEAIRAATDGKGADVVYDAVGGDLSEPAMRALRFGGRHLVIGFASGTIPALRWNLILVKGIDILGVHWGVSAQNDLAAHRAHMERLFGWVAEGKLSPHIDAVLPLAEGPEALARLKGRASRGKIVIAPQR